MFISSCTKEGKEQVPFSMAIGNGELMHECFPKHSRMGKARMKEDKDTYEETQKRGVSTESSKVGTKERSPDGLSLPNQNTILIYIIRYYFKWYGKSKMKYN